MKKNLLRNFVLALGLVACFTGSSFAANNRSIATAQTQVVQNSTCEFKGNYVLSKDSLKELQEVVAKQQEEVFNDMGVDFIDMKIRKVDLKINDNGTGKFRISFDIKTNSDLGVNVYGKNDLVFDISQKDENTFNLDYITNSAMNSDSTNSDIKLYKDSSSKNHYLTFVSNNGESLKFKKIR